jgi:hypothetical protein
MMPVILTNSHFEWSAPQKCYVEYLTDDRRDPTAYYSPSKSDRMCANGLIDQRTSGSRITLAPDTTKETIQYTILYALEKLI